MSSLPREMGEIYWLKRNYIRTQERATIDHNECFALQRSALAKYLPNTGWSIKKTKARSLACLLVWSWCSFGQACWKLQAPKLVVFFFLLLLTNWFLTRERCAARISSQTRNNRTYRSLVKSLVFEIVSFDSLIKDLVVTFTSRFCLSFFFVFSFGSYLWPKDED